MTLVFLFSLLFVALCLAFLPTPIHGSDDNANRKPSHANNVVSPSVPQSYASASVSASGIDDDDGDCPMPPTTLNHDNNPSDQAQEDIQEKREGGYELDYTRAQQHVNNLTPAKPPSIGTPQLHHMNESETEHDQNSNNINSNSDNPSQSSQSLQEHQQQQQQQHQHQHQHQHQQQRNNSPTILAHNRDSLPPIETIHHDFTQWTQRKEINIQSQHIFITHFEHNHEMVRGVAARHDVLSGEVLISVPFHALISADSIERDAVLKPVIGRGSAMWYNARRFEYAEEEEGVDELLPLSIYLLYHVSLGVESPIVEYINILLSAPIDGMPVLWNKERLMREYPDENHGVQDATEEILDNMRGMYEAIMPGLVQERPDIFDNANEMYSFDQFRWVFAMLNSRHWHLPCDELDYELLMDEEEEEEELEIEALDNEEEEEADVQTMILHNDGSSNTNDLENDMYTSTNNININTHAFLAPLADLVNFGPPCAKGTYNKDTASFDIIATCDLMAGQEVTFWYTDDCADIVLANYGFTHPLVKRCLTGKEWQERSIMWQEAAEDLERQLVVAWDEVDRLQGLLSECDSGEDVLGNQAHGTQQQQKKPLREHRVRGNHGGIRKKTGQYDDGSL